MSEADNGKENPARGNWLRDLILGGQDGLVNVLGIALGISAASSDVHVLIAAGLAATFAEATSMGAVAYTSSLAERDRYAAELDRLRHHIRENPESARVALRKVYAAKGFSGELLDRIVATITADEQTWLRTAMSEELNLEPVDMSAVRHTAVNVTIATVVGSLIPLAPFFLLARTPAIITSVVISGLVLFGIGAYEARTSVGDWRWKGLQMLLIGLGAAFVGFLVGLLFHTVG